MSHLYHLSFSPLTRIHSPSDVLGKSLADLQKQFSEILTRSQWEKEEAQVRERKLQEEVALHQEKLASGQEEFRQACERALEARVREGQEAARGKCLENIHIFQQITVLPFSCKYSVGNSWVVQWLRFLAFTAQGQGSIPGWGTKIPQAAQPKQKKKKSVCYVDYTLIKYTFIRYTLLRYN